LGEQWGYGQGVKIDDTIYVSGQLSHDDQGNMVGAPPVSNPLSSRDGQLYQIHAVRDPTHVAQIGWSHRVSFGKGHRRVTLQGRVAAVIGDSS
jgi:hypothetical protein